MTVVATGAGLRHSPSMCTAEHVCFVPYGFLPEFDDHRICADSGSPVAAALHPCKADWRIHGCHQLREDLETLELLPNVPCISTPQKENDDLHHHNLALTLATNSHNTGRVNWAKLEPGVGRKRILASKAKASRERKHVQLERQREGGTRTKLQGSASVRKTALIQWIYSTQIYAKISMVETV